MLRAPLESGRQAPGMFALALLTFGIIIQLLMGLIVYVAADPTVYPGYFKIPVLISLYTFIGILILLGILFSIPYIYKRHGVKQYILGSIVLLNSVSIMPFFCSIFFLSQNESITFYRYIWIAFILLLLGMGNYLVAKVFLLKKVQKGKFKANLESDTYQEAVREDGEIFSKMVPLFFGLVGSLMIIGNTDLSEKSLAGIMFTLSYFFGIHLYAQSKLLIYCKRRFKSFNFTKDGELYPWSSGDKVTSEKEGSNATS